MADLIDAGSQLLARVRKASASHEVTYRRGANSVPLQASVGITTFESTDEQGMVHVTESRDFIIAAADLVLDSVLTTPQRGDTITEVNPETDEEHIYKVLEQDGEASWRYTDSARRSVRISTRKV